MTLMLSGIGASRGIAIGKAHVIERGQPEIPEYQLLPDQIDNEVIRFQQAITTASQQLESIRERIPAHTPADIATFIDTHLLMLRDSALSEAPARIIRERQCNAEWAIRLQLDSLVQVFDEMDDPYLKTRKDDVIHVGNRILRVLLNQETQAHAAEVLLEGAIVIADDLTPADTILLQHQHIGAFVTEYGGPMSHTAIMARSLNIPAVLGVHHAREYLRNEEQLIVDGSQGVIIADPDKRTLKHYQKKQKKERRYLTSLRKLTRAPAMTLDGAAVSLQANIELPGDMDDARKANAAGIGLYRTEFLFMNRNGLPDEEEQYQAYRHMLESLPDRPVTIRTLDLGADKSTDGHDGGAPPTNPALGLRAIRLCLRDPGLFKPQLRAILRASAHGKCRLMIPMLSNTQELFQVLCLIEEIRHELREEGHAFDPEMPIGGMIEVPAAAISADAFAQHLDFLSIGTNDLIQYTLAIDRIDDEVNYLFDPLHPAVLHLIHHVITAGQRNGIPVSMCGEMAGDIRYTRLLLGLGLREFSMQSTRLLEVKSIINKTRLSDLEDGIRRILDCQHSDITAALVEDLNHS